MTLAALALVFCFVAKAGAEDSAAAAAERAGRALGTASRNMPPGKARYCGFLVS
jgi:hypothetical protein